MSEWQPIETAPRDGTEILCCECVEIFIGFWSGNNVDGYWDSYEEGAHYIDSYSPTHWMPLPEPPKE